MVDTVSAVLGSRRLAGDANHIRTKLVVGATAFNSAIATPNHAAYEKVLDAVHCHDERFKQRRTVFDSVYRAILGVLKLRGEKHKTVIRHRYAEPETFPSRKTVKFDGKAVDW